MAIPGLPPTPSGITYPQDYTLKTLVLLTPGGTMDLKNSMIEVSYFEDIFSSVVTGKLLVSEAQGLIEKLHMSGNEYLRLVFSKADNNSDFDINLLFRVYKISDRQLVGNLQTEGYVLYFCSEEFILSEQYKVNKSYKDKRISQIIADIMINYLKVPDNKGLDVEITQGIYSFIVPNLKPFEAINWLANYALSGTTGSYGADMLFFENKDGFVFSSLQSLFTNSIYRSYTYQPKNVDTNNIPADQKFYSVLSYDFVDTFDTLEGIMNGSFANRLISLDPLLQKYSITDFNYADYFKKSQSLNKYPVVNGVKNRFDHTVLDTPESLLKMGITNSGHQDNPYIKNKPVGSHAKDIFLEKSIPNRTAQLSLANYNKLKLVINGDPGAVVGRTINFDLLSMDPKDTGKTTEKFYSGKYLITAVKHVIKIDEYRTTIEIAKDSVPTQYNTPNNDNVLWKNTVKGII